MNSKNVLTTSNDKPQLPDAAGRIDDLLSGLVNIRHSIEEAGGVSTGLPFLSINNAGLWGFGQDRIEVEAGSLWAVDVRTLKHGYIAWPGQQAKERKPLGERMVPASQPLPVLATLPDVGQPYQLQFSFELLCMSGQDEGTAVLYKNGSYGARVAVQELVAKVGAQARNDQSKLCPVVTLEIRSYFHTEWKKDIYNPILQIQKWMSFADFDTFNGLDANATALPKPKAEPEVAARGNGRRTPEPKSKAKPVPVATRRPGRRTQPSA